MPSHQFPHHELHAPVGNLFLLDQLRASVQAFQLLARRHRQRWPLRLIEALLLPEPDQCWGEAAGYQPGEVLQFTSARSLDHPALFRARLHSYCTAHSSHWLLHRLIEDFAGLYNPGEAGLLLGYEPGFGHGPFPMIQVCGYLMVVSLEPHPANEYLPQLAASPDIHLQGNLLICGGWLNTDAIHGYDSRADER